MQITTKRSVKVPRNHHGREEIGLHTTKQRRVVGKQRLRAIRRAAKVEMQHAMQEL